MGPTHNYRHNTCDSLEYSSPLVEEGTVVKNESRNIACNGARVK